MKTLPYPSAMLGLTPKMVQQALKRLVWSSLKPWHCESDMLRARIAEAKAHFKGITIEYLAEPKRWALVCALWNSRSMARVRDGFDPEALVSLGVGWSNLEILATRIVIHWVSLENERSPMIRLSRMLSRVTISRTPEQEIAHQRAEARRNEALTASRGIFTSARVMGERIVFDTAPLFGGVAAWRKAEYVRFEIPTGHVVVERLRIEEAGKALRGTQTVTAAIAPRAGKPGELCLSLRWTRGDGRVGGLDLWNDEGIHEDWCLVVTFPKVIPPADETTIAATDRPEWSDPAYIKAVMEKQERARNHSMFAPRGKKVA